jgi:hypothetical protein
VSAGEEGRQEQEEKQEEEEEEDRGEGWRRTTGVG